MTTRNFTPAYNDRRVAHLDSLIDRYETIVLEYMSMMDRPISAGLYMDVFAAYASCSTALASYETERARLTR